MPRLLCPFCKHPTRHYTTEHAMWVFDGLPVCDRLECRSTAIARTQTNTKCREFGMQPYYETARPFPGGGP